MYTAALAIGERLHNSALMVRSYFVHPASRWNVVRFVPL